MKPEELKVELIPRKPRIVTVDNLPTFVKVEHVPSKITVTKYHRSQYKAKEEAIEELEILVELWSGDLKGE